MKLYLKGVDKMVKVRLIAEAELQIDEDELDKVEGELPLAEAMQRGFVTLNVTKFEVITEEGEFDAKSEALTVENLNQQIMELIKTIG
jgi:hypothetical protein